MRVHNRRTFLKASGLTAIPALLPAGKLLANDRQVNTGVATPPMLQLYGDGRMLTESEYIDALLKLNTEQGIKRDIYGRGGVVAALEKKFEEITGKEKAMYMPTGTMANQLAIAVLSGKNTKVFVQDTSHVYRDEADAAQSVFGKRLMPLAKEETYFTAEQLKAAIDGLRDTEVFASGIGAVSIENPVRRRQERHVPMAEIKKISEYCRSQHIPLHLDGARIHMAAAWSGNSVKEYASYFDTVYISLYKYLGAHAGAILCGDKKVMEQMEHLVKIHGGTQFGNWPNAALALQKLESIDQILKKAIAYWNELMPMLNKIGGFEISALEGGTNTYQIQLADEKDGGKFQDTLLKEYRIQMPRPSPAGKSYITVNETLLARDKQEIVDGFAGAIGRA